MCNTQSTADNLVVFVGSEGVGRGDDELGAILMGPFLDTLSQLDNRPSHVLFVNAGAKLPVAGSPVLPQLAQLEEMGTEVLTCGTCLKYYDLGDKLVVGRVSNMLTILEILSTAAHVIRP